jgi:predicted HTH transcriptional regulator
MMLLLNKPAKDWGPEDVQRLLGMVEPAKTLDFKRELHLDTSEQRQEFRYDVASFANASGGHIVYGIAETKGVASEALGLCLQKTQMDALRRQMADILATFIEPRILSFELYAVDMENGQKVLILEIPRSWAAPHAVRHNDSLRFYTRSGGCKRLLEVAELRSAFLLSDSLTQRIRSFHVERLARIQAGETPVPLNAESKRFAHHSCASARYRNWGRYRPSMD